MKQSVIGFVLLLVVSACSRNAPDKKLVMQELSKNPQDLVELDLVEYKFNEEASKAFTARAGIECKVFDVKLSATAKENIRVTKNFPIISSDKYADFLKESDVEGYLSKEVERLLKARTCNIFRRCGETTQKVLDDLKETAQRHLESSYPVVLKKGEKAERVALFEHCTLLGENKHVALVD